MGGVLDVCSLLFLSYYFILFSFSCDILLFLSYFSGGSFCLFYSVFYGYLRFLSYFCFHLFVISLVQVFPLGLLVVCSIFAKFATRFN